MLLLEISALVHMVECSCALHSSMAYLLLLDIWSGRDSDLSLDACAHISQICM